MDTYEDFEVGLADLMTEPPGGHPLGRIIVPPGAAEFAAAGDGVAIVRTADAYLAGMTAHRGVLHPDEYVDEELLWSKLGPEIGFTLDEWRQVSRPGRPRNGDARLGARINARLAELHSEGANFAVLASVLGVTPQSLGERARKAALVANGTYYPSPLP